MNIFFLDYNPEIAAQYLCDAHIRKMGIESVQMLCTAHRVLDGKEYWATSHKGRRVRRWVLPDARDFVLYHATHVNHGCSKWVRESIHNYEWLEIHAKTIFKIWSAKHNKIHKCDAMLNCLPGPPSNIPRDGPTRPYLAMPEEYKVPSTSVNAYREFYIRGKAHLHKWTYNSTPDFIKKSREIDYDSVKRTLENLAIY